jgi:flavin reductase (DIM6/NTAB) family NADH-FMN oxidoreductase RutF
MATAFTPDADNTRTLRNAFGRFATGVTVVTTNSEAGPIGITANSFSSLSLDPALVLWSPAKGSRRFPYFEKADHFAIHVLAADQGDICDAFAKSAYAYQKDFGTFNAQNVPLIDNCLARFECARVAAYPGGDHMIMVGQVIAAEMRDGDPLAFYAGKYGKLVAQR